MIYIQRNSRIFTSLLIKPLREFKVFRSADRRNILAR